ncbi:MAG: secretin and TonB N-terminal domain-containing protein [Candidatus Omnitrophica bacterium]|nr:secretin and TonB N-terminal domain-containing protein [Candidatus Omnitrophota bacterium]
MRDPNALIFPIVIFIATGLWLSAGGTLYSEERADIVVNVSNNSTTNQVIAQNVVTEEKAAQQPKQESVSSEKVVSPAPQKGDEVSPIPGGMEGKLSLDLRSIDIVDALKFLAVKVGLNIIATKNVTGRVTLMVDSVPVKDVFDIMLRSNGLAFVKEGDIYNVMTEDEYKAMYGRKFSDLRQVKAFRLQYAIPEQAFSMLDALKSDVGRVLVDPDSGTVMIMDTPDNIKRTEQALLTLEQKNLVQVFTLKYARAKEVEEQLKPQLDGKKVGFIKADDRSNQIIVQALPERMSAIERLISSMDKKTKEVLIDTKIVKVKLSTELTSGVDWEGLFNVGSQLGTTYVGSYPFSVLQASTAAWQSRQSFLNSQGGNIGAYPFSGNSASVNASQKVAPGEMHVGVIKNKKDFDTVIKYLQTLGNTQLLSNPKLAVINNQEAKIHIGERQAYVTSTTTSGQTTSTVSEEVTFIDVGIQLSVTPTINDDGYVTMKVKPEVSSVVSYITTPSGNKIPIIDTSTAETTVMVKDGSTIIIGGLRKEEKASSSTGIPFLSKIPFIGLFFQSGSKKTERTELLVMLTPHIVTGDTLVTGDEREFGTKPGKEYQPYKPFLADTDLEPAQHVIEQKMKPYREYGDLKPQLKELAPVIKGGISD